MTDHGGTHILPDPATDYGQHVRRRLAEEEIIWLCVVNSAGIPQPNPVWFLWIPDEDDEWGDGSFLIYHRDTAARVRSLKERPKVTLHFDGGIEDRDVSIFSGEVEVMEGHPPVGEVPKFVAKYTARAQSYFGTPVGEALAKYSVATRIRPTKVRGN